MKRTFMDIEDLTDVSVPLTLASLPYLSFFTREFF
jgi:hypothetical protein